jgi:heat shock protein HtpX
MSAELNTIETELSEGHLAEALDFIKEYYLLPQPERFPQLRMYTRDGYKVLNYPAQDKTGEWTVDVEITARQPFQVKLTPSRPDIQEVVNRLSEEVFIAIQYFEDLIRQSTLYFAWVEGKEIIPEKPPTQRKKTSFKIFGSNLLLIYLLFFGVNIVLFLLLGMYAAVAAILGVQLVIVLLSDRILDKTADWTITPENPRVHILEYQLPVEDFKEFRKKFGKDEVLKMKNEIYQRSLAQGQEPTCDLGEDIFQKYGFHCQAEEKVSKVVDVYRIVETAAMKFGIPMPRIAVSNTMIANAAATGPSPSRGLVLITTGLLVQLEEDEILAVLGHEMGHLAGRDPLILFTLISVEFILRFTILLPLVILSPIVYLIVALGFIFFVAKFFETRADLLSAMKIGQPQVLARALRKIGYQRLQAERISPTRAPSWLNFDPHPPIYFRIDRLERMKTPLDVKRPLLKSARDVFDGFKRSLGIK